MQAARRTSEARRSVDAAVVKRVRGSLTFLECTDLGFGDAPDVFPPRVTAIPFDDHESVSSTDKRGCHESLERAFVLSTSVDS